MKEFEKIESLLKTKKYDELSSSEKKLVDKELSKESYEELRQSLSLLKGEKLSVHKSVKHSLMSEFKQHNRSGILAIFQRPIPAYSLIAPFLFLIALFWYRPKKEVPVIQERLVEVTVRDTVQVVKTDTLWREKLVKVPQLVYVETNVGKDEPQKIEVANRPLDGQKEVLDLVVRGD